MAVPDFQTLMLPFLKFLADRKEHTLAEVLDHLSAELALTTADKSEVLSTGQSRFYNRVGWAATYLKKGGLIQSGGPGRYAIVERGESVLSESPSKIDIGFLEARFSEVSDFRKRRARPALEGEEPSSVFDQSSGAWMHRPLVEGRILTKLQHWIGDEQTRLGALEFVAMAVENANEERPGGWCLRETDNGLRLMAGRLAACELAKAQLKVAVIAPISADARLALAADSENDEESKKIADGIIITFPVEHAQAGIEKLSERLNAFVDEAMARIRTTPSLQEHSPEAITCISKLLGRSLPQPIPEFETKAPKSDEHAEDEDNQEPRVRGRAPIFETGNRAVAALVDEIERNVIALPDLQRAFVWEDTKVRDLLDSLFIGFPVGTLVLWYTNDDGAHALGTNKPALRATTLVIDGQQRLTSLYAVVQGADVQGKDGSLRKITIAFRPRDGRFTVADAATTADPEYLANITELWAGPRQKLQIRRDLLNGLRDRGRSIDQQYEDAVEINLERAQSIINYRFPTVEIRNTANTTDVSEEDVAEIFVRINNQGKRLGQADFVLTLLSVYHPQIRDRLEDFSHTVSDATMVEIDAQQLLRVACAVAFGRARMSAMYKYLRGIDALTGSSDLAGRSRRLGELDAAANACLDRTMWQDYLVRVKQAGFVNSSLISSRGAIANAYAFFVRGRQAGVQRDHLDKLISRWAFGTLLIARYSGASETAFEEDLALVAETDAQGFVLGLDGALSEKLSGDYWSRTLISALTTQKARTPAALGFRASQIVLGSRALFSDNRLEAMLDSRSSGSRSTIEVHHLFPKAWLERKGVRDRRQINQVANMADLGWYENAVIGGRGPAEYVPLVREKLGIDDARWARMCAEHALPTGWESMNYDQFLAERRLRMTEIIRAAFQKLGGESDVTPVTPPWFLPGADHVWRKIAETERALRRFVREVYTSVFGKVASTQIEAALSTKDAESLQRALRSRPAGADPLSVVDYLYLGQLLPLIFAKDVWPTASNSLRSSPNAKQILDAAMRIIAPVRNEIAHVREVDDDRLMRATVACSDILKLLPNSG